MTVIRFPLDPEPEQPSSSAGDAAQSVTDTNTSPHGREEMEDLAAATVLAGRSRDSARDELDHMYAASRKRLEEIHARQTEHLRMQKEHAVQDLGEARQRAEQLRKDRDDATQDLARRRGELCRVNAAVKERVYEIRQYLLKQADERLKKRQELFHTCAQNVVERFKGVSELRRAYREILLTERTAEWERDSKEYQERAKRVRQEQEKTEERLKPLNVYSDTLRKIGVTRNVSGFLFWAGSVSVAATSILLSSFISGHANLKSSLDQFASHLRTLMFGTAQTIDPVRVLTSILSIAGVVLAFGLVVMAVTAAVQYLSGKAERAGQQSQGMRGRGQNRGRGTLLRLLPRSVAQRDWIASIDALTVTPTTVMRTLPGMVTIALASCILIALTPPSLEFGTSAASVALAFALSFHATIVMFATAVLGPHLYRMLDTVNKDASETPRSLWTLRLVLSGAAASAVAAVTTLAIAPRYPLKDGEWDWSIAPVAVVVMLGGFALAASIVLRGIYRDIDFLQNRREWLRREIADLEARPTADDIEIDNDSLEEGIASYRSRTAAADYDHYLELQRLSYDDWGELSELREHIDEVIYNKAPKGKSARPPGWRPAQALDAYPLYRLEHPEGLPFFNVLDGELLQQFNDANSRRSQLVAEIEMFERRLTESSNDLAVLVQQITTLEGRSAVYQDRLTKAEREYMERILALERSQMKDRILLDQAWAVAERGFRELDDDGSERLAYSKTA